MAIRQGNSAISALYLGSTEITKVYQGTVEIYNSAPTPPPVFEPYTIDSWDLKTGYNILEKSEIDTNKNLMLFRL